MYLRLSDEQKMVQETIRRFVETELIPLENECVEKRTGRRPGISQEKLKELQLKAKEFGFWGINTPEEYGGADLGQMMMAIVADGSIENICPIHFWRFGR